MKHIYTTLLGFSVLSVVVLMACSDGTILEPDKIIFTSGKDGFLKTGMPVAKTYLDKKNKIKIRSLADPQQASIVHITKGQFKN